MSSIKSLEPREMYTSSLSSSSLSSSSFFTFGFSFAFSSPPPSSSSLPPPPSSSFSSSSYFFPLLLPDGNTNGLECNSQNSPYFHLGLHELGCHCVLWYQCSGFSMLPTELPPLLSQYSSANSSRKLCPDP